MARLKVLMMLADLADLFNATVRHSRVLGFNAHAEPELGRTTSCPARVLYRARMIRDAKGGQTVSRGEAWIAGSPHIGLSDRITLPDGTTPRILAVESLTDEAGPSHVHIFFG